MSPTPISFYEYCAGPTADDSGWRPLDSSYPEITRSITDLRIATWNVWFDEVGKHTRFEGLLKELLVIPALDVVSLQEVTPQFLEWLQLSKGIRSDWLLTNSWDSDHRREIPENWYGCVFLVKKRLAGNIRGWVKKFPTSKMGRFVVMAEIFQKKEYSPYPDVEEREREANICLELLCNKHNEGAVDLCASTLKIYSGDLNTVTTSELNYITSHSFNDTITSSDMEPLVENARSATLGLTFALPEYPPRRSDFILYKGESWECVEHNHFGEKPIVDSNDMPFHCIRGRNGLLYPSDHLGVCATFKRKVNGSFPEIDGKI